MPPHRNMNYPKAKLNFQELSKTFRYGKAYLPLILLALVFSSVAAVFVILTPSKIQEVTDLIKEGIFTPAGVDMDKVLATGMVVVAFIATYAIAGFVGRILSSEATHRLSRRLRSEIGAKIDRLPLRYFDSNTTGDILSRITNDVDTISQTLGTSIAELLSGATQFIGVIIMMFTVNYILSFVTIGASLFGFVGVSIVVAISQKFFRARQKCLGEMNGYIEEMYSNHKMVKAFNAEGLAKNEFGDINGRLRTNNRRAMFLSSLMGPIMNFTGNLSYALVFIVGVSLAINGNGVTFGVIIAFTLYARQFSNPLTTFAQSLSSMQQASAASSRVFEMLDAEELEDEKEKLSSFKDVKGDVTFDHVSFSYDPSREIIHDFSADLKAGMKVAIVGPTGAGKTTMVNLLMRFYDVGKGEIRIDGVNIRDYKREAIHDLFDMILQDTWLFNGTVRENLVFNKEGVDQATLDKVCEAVGLDHYVASLPNGYDSPIDENTSLSEGQKQQLTIARAMIKDSPMLILDEATSSVDTRTEIRIQKAMDELTKGRTSFVIAHRLSTIKNADVILVMKDGDIVEHGPHKELLAKGGFYAELYNSQFQKAE